ncbi:unnamed protein product [Cylicocyclus nassatus]|uniref:Aspartyl/asparaginy/proline hydroxylase domain-containing protein n=2 Tax=Strongylidae TaxID=27830 RepID=A0AA36HHW1_CYLNA|nr:unnamed protein product [Cylicocyclus nassatus]
MATKQNGNTIPSPRPPFRRQGSSIGAGAHPMAVALAPVPKIDYSVTKGGARTWAVLLVFLFLCSGLYTIFSSREYDGSETSISNEQQDEVGDDSQSYSDYTPKQRRGLKGEDEDEDIKEEISDIDSEQTIDDDEEAAAVEPALEDQLFAGLRKKIQNNIQRVKDYVKDENTERAEEEEEEERQEQVPPKRGKRRKNRNIERDDDVEQVKEAKPPRRRRKGKADAESEEQPAEEDHAENEKSKEEEEKGGKPETKEDTEEDEEEEKEKEEEEEEESAPEKDEGGSKEGAEEDEEDKKGQRRKPRSYRARHVSKETMPERECRRKNCPPNYDAAPRKSLLKKKYKVPSSESHPIRPEHVFEDDENDDDEDEEDELPIPTHAKHHEVVALNKQSRGSGRDAYKRQAITNRDDHKNREALDRADSLVEKHDYDAAISIFDSILRSRPDSPRAHFGKGRAYQLRGELTSNDVDFAHAIHEYDQVLDNEETPNALFRQAASRLIELASFRGDFYRCLLTHRSLVDRFPEEIEHQTDVALTFIKMKRLKDAKKVLYNLIEDDSNNAVALAYYGYILKVAEDNVEQGVAFMKKGLRLGGDEITDPKFYYHLGQGLMILGRSSEAYAVFEHAASLGLFLSAQQRSMYNVEGLTGRAWWSSEQTGYAKYLKAVERQWVSIRAEATRAFHTAPDSWKDENPTITVDGRWTAFPLLENGHFNLDNCEMTPQTCSILKEFRESSNASRSEMRFSALTSGTQILPHCGATNSRLQAHLGLIVPSEARIRVGNEQRGWKTGKFIIFDDSFEHELQFEGASSSSLRLILLIDLWHPEVESQKRTAPEDD